MNERLSAQRIQISEMTMRELSDIGGFIMTPGTTIKLKVNIKTLALEINTWLHFEDDNFTYILVNENWYIFIQISLKFIPRGPFSNTSSTGQVLAWHRRGGKSLSEPVMT